MWPRQIFFYRRCKIHQWKGMPSLVTLLPFVFELSSKNHRGGGPKWSPPPHTGRRLMSRIHLVLILSRSLELFWLLSINDFAKNLEKVLLFRRKFRRAEITGRSWYEPSGCFFLHLLWQTVHKSYIFQIITWHSINFLNPIPVRGGGARIGPPPPEGFLVLFLR